MMTNVADSFTADAASSWSSEAVLNAARVLVVSASVRLRRQVAERLRRDGYHVLESRNGLELLARIDRSLDRFLPAEIVDRHGKGRWLQPAHDPVNLVVLDISNDTWDGLTLLEALRRQDRTLPVILVVSRATDAVVAEARRLAVDALFERPLDLEKVTRTALCLEPPLAAAVG